MGAPVPQAERDKAVAIYAKYGPSEASRRTGYSKAAICNWAKAAGVKTEVPALTEATRMSVARRQLSMAEWREEMTEVLRSISLEAGQVEAKLLSARGKNTPALDKATSARAKAISDLMLLTGEATQRIGLSTSPSEQAEQVARLRDELAERRAKLLHPIEDTG